MEARIEALVPQIKSFMEARIVEASGNRIKLSIGDVDGGILRPFTFNDISVLNSEGSPLFSSIVINNIKTDYRIWDGIFDKRDGTYLSTLLGKNFRAYVNFVSIDRTISGFLSIKGNVKELEVTGYVHPVNKDRINFNGSIVGDSFVLEIRPPEGAIVINGNVSQDAVITADVQVNHLRLFGYDVVCIAKWRNKILSSAGDSGAPGIEGELSSESLIVNFRPLLKLKSNYSINGKRCVYNVLLGDGIKASGNVFLEKPYPMDLTVLVNNISINWLLSSLGVQDSASILSGTMNGKFAFNGPAAKPELKAHMEIRGGTISSLDFEYLSANLKGELPVIAIEDSRITRESGYFALGGEVDFSKAGKTNMFDRIKIASDDRAITWDGWNTTKGLDFQEITMKKRLGETINLGFKKFISNEMIDESLRGKDQVEVEYKLHPTESLKMIIGQNNDFVGLEHKDKF